MVQLNTQSFSHMSAIAHTNTSAIPASATQTENLPRVTADAVIDQRLVRRFTGGDETAFVEIMERYRAKILGVTLGLLRNHADAEEITQDTFIRAHRGLAKFRGDSALSTWLYRIAVNLSRNRYWYFFRRRRQDSVSLDCPLTENNTATFSDLVADVGQDPAQETIMNEFSIVVDWCMTRLDAPHREILNLRNIQHRSYEDIALALRINVGTVKSRIARARENLRTLLAEVSPEYAAGGTTGEWFLPSRVTYGRPAIACA
jgi:RNA polymerase sigma-70 factor (ECF subfamily)